MLFVLGRVVVTPGASAALDNANTSALALLGRHVHGDWGQIGPRDIRRNEDALLTVGRIVSLYPLSIGETIMVITEADRSTTTLMLPDEY
jgi:hypothetical protein